MVQMEEAGLQNPPRKRLLILSCSRRKRPDEGFFPTDRVNAIMTTTIAAGLRSVMAVVLGEE